MRCFSSVIHVVCGVNFCRVFAFSSVLWQALTGETLHSVEFLFMVAFYSIFVSRETVQCYGVQFIADRVDILHYFRE